MTLTKYIPAFACACVLALSACSKSPDVELFTETDIPHAELGENVIPTKYQIDLRLDPQADRMSGLVHIEVDVTQATQQIWLHGKHITATESFITQGEDVIPAVFTQIDEASAPSGVAKLTTESPVMPGKAMLTLAYTTPYNLSLNSAYKVTRGEDAYIVTQFEPLGAREAFPSFDEPRFKVPFEFTISSPAENEVYFNTPLMSTLDAGGGWTKHVFSTTRPLPTYLIAFGAGPWDVVDYGNIPANEVRSRPIRLRGFAANGSGDKFDYALENTAGILEAMEIYFGSEYPYEKLDLIAAPEYAFGAMENPGAIVYLEYLLLLDENAPLSQKRAYARVHSHELAHQWFGNLVTPVWWEDIWLNEAFATWMGNKAIDLWQPEGNYDRLTLSASLGAMNIDSLSSTRRVREPLERSENVMDQFDGITYRKGGGVLSMFESYLGEPAFQSGVRLHMDRYADSVATGDDFFKSIAEGSQNPDVVKAMKSFVDQPGLPMVTASLTCEDGAAELTLSQSRYAPLGSRITQGTQWDIPVCAGLTFEEGSREKVCSLLTEPQSTTELIYESCPVSIMPNENGAGYYRFALSNRNWFDLFENFDTLNGREALSALDSLTAAFKSGDVDPAIYLTGIEVFAGSEDYDVASQAGSQLSWMHSYLPDSAMPALSDLVNDMYAARYAASVGTDSVEGNLLAPTLAARLLRFTNNPVLRAEYSLKGAQYLGLDGDADKTAVASNLLGQALQTVAIDRGEEAFEPLLAFVKEGGAREKAVALNALSSVRDPALHDRLRAMALSDEDAMTGRQARTLIGALLSNSIAKEETWNWLKTNFDSFVPARISDVHKPGLPGYAPGCSSEARDEAEAFFTSKTALIPGYERSLAQTLERIELCAALNEATIEKLSTALTER